MNPTDMSLAITAGVCCLAAAMYWLLPGRAEGGAVGQPLEHVLGCDWFGLLWFRLIGANTSAIVPVAVWAVLPLLIAVAIPTNSGNTEYFTSKAGLIVTFNYAAVVPLLLGAYLSVLAAANNFLDPKMLKKLGLGPRKWLPVGAPGSEWWRKLGRYVVPTTIALLALKLQHMGIEAEEDGILVGRPWVDDRRHLNYAGAVYYSLRGLDAMMALGLFVSIFSTMLRVIAGLSSVNPQYMYTKALRVRSEVRDLGGALVVAILLSSTVIALHGAGLALETRIPPEELLDKQRSVDAASSLTWLAWTAGTIITTATLACWFMRLNHMLSAGVAVHEERAIKALDSAAAAAVATRWASAGGQTIPGEADQVASGAKYWEGREAIRTHFERVRTWPLPKWVGLGLAAPIAVQGLAWLFGKFMT